MNKTDTEHPELCYGLLPKFKNREDGITYGDCIVIFWGETGYHPTNYPEGKYTQEMIDGFNEKLGVSKDVAMAMKDCSMINKLDTLEKWEKQFGVILDIRKTHIKEMENV